MSWQQGLWEKGRILISAAASVERLCSTGVTSCRDGAETVQVIPCEDCVAWQPAGGQEPGHGSAQCSGFDLYFGSKEPDRARRRREAKLGRARDRWGVWQLCLQLNNVQKFRQMQYYSCLKERITTNGCLAFPFK